MTRLERPAAATVLALGMSLILTPLAQRVWTTEIVPAANRVHFGDGLIVLMSLAGFALYLLTSLLFVRRRPISPAGSVPVLRGAGTSSRPGTDAAGVLPASPGTSTPAATNSQPVASGLGLTAAEATRASASAVMTAVAVPRGAAADGSGVPNSARPAPRPAEGRATGRGVTPTRRVA